MWLPKLERELLAYYYKKDCSIERLVSDIREPMLVVLDEVINECGYRDKATTSLKIDKANADLKERKLATVDFVSRKSFGKRNVTLTIKGKDLGRKYSHILDTIGLWCAAIEHKWLWFIITFVAGFLAKWLFEIFLQ